MTQPRAKLLVVDDNESNLDILLGLLEAYDVIVALDGDSALDLLQYETPDVILLDIIMPGIDGYEVCRRIKANPDWCDLPILFITAKTDEASLVRAFDVGGSDYVTKPFRSRELLARVRIQVEYRRAMEQLRQMAVTDELTGLRNRRAFFEDATGCFLEASAQGSPLGALMIDIDHFKAINDRFGHAVGDEALRCVADNLRRELLPNQILGRLGGEEFAILVCDEAASTVDQLAERLCEAIGHIRLDPPASGLIMSASIGVALLQEGAADLDDLLNRADDRLYQAKHDGRNRVRSSTHIRSPTSPG